MSGHLNTTKINCSPLFKTHVTLIIHSRSWFASNYISISLTLSTHRTTKVYKTDPISWLMMPWLLVSPGHHQTWYWHITVFLGGKGSIIYIKSIVRNYRMQKIQHHICEFIQNNLAHKGLINIMHIWDSSLGETFSLRSFDVYSSPGVWVTLFVSNIFNP